MPPTTRSLSFPRVIVEKDTDSEHSSSEEEEEEDDEEPLDDEDEDENGKSFENEGQRIEEESSKKGKAPITLSLKKVCKVSFRFEGFLRFC